MLILTNTSDLDVVLDLIWKKFFSYERKFPTGGFGKNVTIFGADVGSSVHVDNKEKDISILGEGSTQTLDVTTLNAEKKVLHQFYWT